MSNEILDEIYVARERIAREAADAMKTLSHEDERNH